MLVMLMVLAISGLGMAGAFLAAGYAPVIFEWIQDRLESIPNAIKRLSSRQRKLQRKEREATLDKERTEQYRAALEDEWDAKLELHSKWIDEYRELTATPHALSCKFSAERGCKDPYTECPNAIQIGALCHPSTTYICGCDSRVKPAPGLKQYFRPWNVVELPPRPAIPEVVMPTNKFKKQSNQQKLDVVYADITPGIVGIRHPLRPTRIKIEPPGFTEAQWHAQETQKQVAEVKAEAELFKSEMQVFYQATEAYRREKRHPYANYQPQHHGPWHHSTDL